MGWEGLMLPQGLGGRGAAAVRGPQLIRGPSHNSLLAVLTAGNQLLPTVFN